MLTVKTEKKKKATTTAKIGKRKEKEQTAISPSHRSRESLVTVMRAIYSDPPNPPLPDTSNPKTEFLGNRLA